MFFLLCLNIIEVTLSQNNDFIYLIVHYLIKISKYNQSKPIIENTYTPLVFTIAQHLPIGTRSKISPSQITERYAGMFLRSMDQG